MPPNPGFPIVESPSIAQQLAASGIAQVIVVLKRPPAPAGAAAAIAPGSPTARLQKHFVTSELSTDSAIRSAVRAATPAAALAAATSTRRHAARPAPAVRVYPNLGVMLGNVNQNTLGSLRADADVAAVVGAPTFSLIRPKSATAVRAPGRVAPGLDMLAIPDLWRQGLSGKGIVVAHLDTGADGRHPMLKKAFAAFAEFDDLGEPVTPAPAPYDTDEHGTHTAGTVVGRPVQNVRLGVAPEAQIASAIVIEGGNVVARILAGLDWAIGHQAKVLSMSLGIRGWQEDFVAIIRILRTRGILPVIAVGNEGPGTSRSPGNYPDALSVGAVGSNRQVADFSSSQRFDRTKDPIVPDLVAPGVDVVSCVPNGRYMAMSGTSMATPHVAGLAALLFEAKPSATVDEIERAILRSCRLVGGMTQDRAGQGLPNGPEALALLTGVRPPARGRPAPKPAKPARRRRKRAGVKARP